MTSLKPLSPNGLASEMRDRWARHRALGPSRESLRRAAVVFVVSRLFVVAAGAVSVAAWAVMDRNMKRVPSPGLDGLVEFFAIWDGHWYMEVARHGYPRVIQADVTYLVPDARAAFFPLFPRIVHYLDNVVPGGPIWVGVILNLLLGALFVYLVGCLAGRYWSPRVAERSMILVSLFPGSFVLGWTYSEALLLVLAAGTLLAVGDRRWILAGALALLAGLTRPNATAVMVACLVASLMALRERREWRSLWAPALAPLGFLGFMVFLAWHTGERLPWFRVQREAWDEGTSFGYRALLDVFEFVVSPFSSPTNMLTAVTIGLVGGLLVISRRKRLPAFVDAYSYTVLFMMLLPATVTARPRFLFTAFPLLISWAAELEDRSEETWFVTALVLGGSLVAVTALYGVRGAIP